MMIAERIVRVPTGNILVVAGDHGRLECLSLGDYGQAHNCKASFLGLDRDLGEVTHREMLPLEEKWVITISTQYGCSMRCSFCDVPNVGPGRNATRADLLGQVQAAMAMHPEVTRARINLHYARMGEPTWNPAVLESATDIHGWLQKCGDFRFHPVVSTMMPRRNRRLSAFVRDWCMLKNSRFGGDAGLQLSINSTDDDERQQMFSGNATSLEAISAMMRTLPPPIGRKWTLNFAVAGWTIDAARLRELFEPARFIVKLTPMHRTATAKAAGLETPGECTTLAPYQHHEEALKAAGFDVLVFVASKEEDQGRITCGNAILSGTEPLTAGGTKA